MSIFFIRNIPKNYDYTKLYEYFSKHGTIKTFSSVFSSDMSYIRFIFLIYQEERSIKYLQHFLDTKNFLIDFTKQESCEIEEYKDTKDVDNCKKLRTDLIKHLSCNNQEDDNLYNLDKEKWITRVIDILNKYK